MKNLIFIARIFYVVFLCHFRLQIIFLIYGLAFRLAHVSGLMRKAVCMSQQ